MSQIAAQTLTHHRPSRIGRFVPRHDLPIALLIAGLGVAIPLASFPAGPLGLIFLALPLALAIYLAVSIRRRK